GRLRRGHGGCRTSQDQQRVAQRTGHGQLSPRGRRTRCAPCACRDERVTQIPPPVADQRRVSTMVSPCLLALIGKPRVSSRTKASVLDQRKLPPTRMAPTRASPI